MLPSPRRSTIAMLRALGSRCAPVIAAAMLAALLVGGGFAGGLDQRLSDVLFAAARHAPTGQVVIVDVARAARERGDSLRLSRARLADLLRIVADAGACRILIDMTLAGATTPADDAALTTELVALTPARVALTASAVVESDAAGAVRWSRTDILPAFTQHAEPVASDLAFDGDGQLRRFGISGVALPPLRSSADWLAGRAPTRDATASRLIDLGVDTAALPVIDAAALLDPRADVARAAAARASGRMVVLANFASALGGEIRVPGLGALQRPVITALSAETLLGRRPPQPVGRGGVLLASMLLSIGVALWSARFRLLLSSAACAGCALVAAGIAAQLQAGFGLTAPIATPVLAAGLGLVAARLARRPTTRDASIEEGGALITFARDGKVLSMNAAARRIFARDSRGGATSVADLTGIRADDLLSATQASRPGHLIAVIGDDQQDRRHLDLTVSTMVADAKTWIGVASIRDVTEQEVQLEELRRMVVEDPLTGVANRLGFERALAEACAATNDGTDQDEADSLAVLLCDLDGFKAVNDVHGHQAGDSLLRTVAQRIGAVLPFGSLVARLGGDEFGILIRDRVDPSGIAVIAGSITAAVAEPVTVGSQSVNVGISIGIALHPSQGSAPDVLVCVADADMYRTKRNRSGQGWPRAA